MNACESKLQPKEAPSYAINDTVIKSDNSLDLMAQIEELKESRETDQDEVEERRGSEITVEVLDTQEQNSLINQYPRRTAKPEEVMAFPGGSDSGRNFTSEAVVNTMHRLSPPFISRQASQMTTNSANSRKSRVNFEKSMVTLKITPVKRESCDIVVCGMSNLNVRQEDRQSHKELVDKMKNLIQ